jgi:4-hydroxy-tetrahydrodipicolinate reductase
MIDFSHPSALPDILDYAIDKKLPLVIATTGMSQEDVALIRESSLSIPVFFTFNMSLGVNLLVELAKKAASILGDGFDVEIIEKHHNQKIDAPSGTALMIADAVSEVLPYNASYAYDRHSVRKKRSREEIGIHSLRGGTIVGEHQVVFAGTDEIITLSHQALSREIFATGALAAARFLVEQRPGLYSMKDIV